MAKIYLKIRGKKVKREFSLFDQIYCKATYFKANGISKGINK